MSGKLNKKNVIAIAIIVVLAIVAITGTVVFLKNRGTADATEVVAEKEKTSLDESSSSKSEIITGETKKNDNSEAEIDPISPVTTENEEEATENNQSTNLVAENDNESTQTVTNDTNNSVATTTTANSSSNNAQSTTQTTSTNNTSSSTGNTGVDSIQETVIVRVVEGEEKKVADDRDIAWRPLELNAVISSAINTEKPNIKITKKAITYTGVNLVTAEEEYTYEITVTSDRDLKNIEIKDVIPEKVTYVSNTVSDNGEELKDENGNVVGLKWNVDLKKDTDKVVSFNVKVKTAEKGTIYNTATANAISSNQVQTAIVESNKAIEIIPNDQTVRNYAKVGDELKFTVTLTNTGLIDGTTTIKDAGATVNGNTYSGLDTLLAKDENEESIAEMVGNVSIIEVAADGTETIISSDKTAQELINGIPNVKVPASGSVKAVFTVKLKKINGTIVNLATYGDNRENPTNPVVVDTADIYIRKNIIGLTVGEQFTSFGDIGVKRVEGLTAGNKITYKIVDKNIGTATLSNFSVTDDKEIYLESVQLPERLVNNGVQVNTERKVANGDNLLGIDNLTAEPNEEFIFVVTYELKKEDVTINNYEKDFVNKATATGIYASENFDGTVTESTIIDDDSAAAGTTYTAPEATGKVTVEKEWIDNNYKTLRPTTITVTLKDSLGNTQSKDINIENTDNSANDEYSCEFDKLPLEKEDGTPITYSVEESLPEGYENKYKVEISPASINASGTIKITNTYNVAKTVQTVKHYEENNPQSVTVPIDVVFVLDTSYSMRNTSGGATRAANMRDAVNATINALKANGENRVAIVGYSGGYSQLLGLTKCENISKNPVSITNSWKLTVKGGKSRDISDGTYTQGGIAKGADVLINQGAPSKTYKYDDENSFTRIPVIILISDGLPTYYTPNYTNVLNSTMQGDSISESVEQGYYTIKSAKYYKNQVSSSYGVDAKMYTVAMNINSIYGQTVLNPTNANINLCNGSEEVLKDSNDLYPDIQYIGQAENEGKHNSYEAAANFYKCLRGDSFYGLFRNRSGVDYKLREINPGDFEGYNANENYSYADAAFTNNVSASTLTQNMLQILNGAIPKKLTLHATKPQIESGKVLLESIDMENTVTITDDSETYSKDDVIVQIEVKYYLDLTKFPPNSNISVVYNALPVAN